MHVRSHVAKDISLPRVKLFGIVFRANSCNILNLNNEMSEYCEVCVYLPYN